MTKGGQLTEAVATRPYSVVLFDEIRRHIPMYSTSCLMYSTMAVLPNKGRLVSFKDTIIIMTSDIGLQYDT